MTSRTQSRLLLLGGIASLVVMVGVSVWSGSEPRAAYAVAFAPKGDRVAAVVEGESKSKGQLWIWDAATGRLIVTATASDQLLSLAFAPDGSAVATGGWSGTVELREPATGRLLRSFSGHSTPVRGLAFLPDARRLVAGASDGSVIVWDLATGQQEIRLDRGRRFPVIGLAVSHEGRFLAAAGGMGVGALSVWELKTSRPLSLASLAGAAEPLAFAPDRVVLAVQATSPAFAVGLIDLDGDRTVSTIPASYVRSLAFSPDGRRIATGGDDETINVQEIESGRSLATFGDLRPRPAPGGQDVRNFLTNFGLIDPPMQNTIWSVAFSPDGTRLASASQDGSIVLWDLPGREAVGSLGRLTLTHPSCPVWLPFFQVTLALAALALFALAIKARGTNSARQPAEATEKKALREKQKAPDGIGCGETHRRN